MTRTNPRYRIIPPIFVGSLLLLLLAVIFQFNFRLHIGSTGGLDNVSDSVGPDVRSALNRVKTEQCRREIIQFVERYQANKLRYLQRSCPLDSKPVERVIRLGCSYEVTLTRLPKLPSSKSALYVVLDDNQATDYVSCNELCYSFGHTFATYSRSSQRCYCADKELFKSYELDPCHQHSTATEQLNWFRVNNGIYHASQHRNPSPKSDRSRVRIAFLLSLNGRSTLQVLRLLKRIYSREHVYYIHVDGREKFLPEDLESHVNNHENIHFSSRRLETIWGGTALLTMMINAIEDLRRYHWHYLINLSESDFPIKNLSELETYLNDNSNESSIYLKAHNTKGYHFIKKQGLNYNFYQCEGRVWRLDKRQLPSGIVYTGGSDWFGLPRDFCDHILEDRYKPSSLVYSLLHIFNFTLLPAESFFHTLASNGEFCDRLVDNNLRVTNWYRKQGCKCQHEKVVDWCGCSPSIYRWIDTARLKLASNSTAIFFSRKFEPTVSNSIIGYVESHLLDRSNNSKLIDTRFWLNTFESTIDKPLAEHAKKFGHLALNQIEPGSQHLSTKSIHKFFDRDKFKGHIYQYCDEKTCMELLITPRLTNQLAEEKGNCFQDDLNLKSLEVNQDFDAVEGLFRNRDPLHSLSNIVVHHEWIVKRTNDSSYQNIGFKWMNPAGEIELIQDAKLKTHPTNNQLSLVHRLQTRKPFRPGLWKLILTKRDKNCLAHEFLVFDANSHDNHLPDQVQFDRFYQVFAGCKKGSELYDGTICSNIDWSLESKNVFLEKYRL